MLSSTCKQGCYFLGGYASLSPGVKSDPVIPGQVLMWAEGKLVHILLGTHLGDSQSWGCKMRQVPHWV